MTRPAAYSGHPRKPFTDTERKFHQRVCRRVVPVKSNVAEALWVAWIWGC